MLDQSAKGGTCDGIGWFEAAHFTPQICSVLAKVRADQILDLPSGRAPLQASHHFLVLDEDERRRRPDAESRDQFGVAVEIELHDVELSLLGDLDPGDETLHPARGPRAVPGDEHELDPIGPAPRKRGVRRDLHHLGVPETTLRKTPRRFARQATGVRPGNY